jgi:hypothetical protein
VLWPTHGGHAESVEPHGIEHRYAPLPIVEITANDLKFIANCRPKLKTKDTAHFKSAESPTGRGMRPGLCVESWAVVERGPAPEFALP